MNYWQMPYEQAKKMHYGLPVQKWPPEREKRGLPVAHGYAKD